MDETTPIVQLADMPVAQTPSPKQSFDFTKLFIPGAILIAGLLISGSILFARQQAGQTAQIVDAGNTGPTLGAQVNLDLSGAPALGDANAPITIVEYADFQCPYCERYFKNDQPMFISEYVNTGKARFIWKDYAFLGQESTWAAEAARCANDQNKFWPYHDYLYSHQGAENSGAFSKANLKKFAVAIGLNAKQFNSCLDTGKYTAFIQQESQNAGTVGVSGTPATFINGKMVVDSSGNSVGAAAFATFKTIIDQELSQ